MRCPFCSAIEDKVVDTRPSDNEQVIRRRRECIGCGRRFTTYERVDEILPLVVKKDGRREPFDRAKILSGLKKACSKRPVPRRGAGAARSTRSSATLEESGEKEIPSSRIGDAVMAALREIDDVAYVRFASVYRSFRDVNELMNELKSLVDRGAVTRAGVKPGVGLLAGRRARYMRRALALAERGRGTTRPEPGGRRGDRARRADRWPRASTERAGEAARRGRRARAARRAARAARRCT